jgi:hypothetical protein
MVWTFNEHTLQLNLFLSLYFWYQDSLVCSLLLSTGFEDNLDMYAFWNFTKIYPFNKTFLNFFDIYNKKRYCPNYEELLSYLQLHNMCCFFLCYHQNVIFTLINQCNRKGAIYNIQILIIFTNQLWLFAFPNAKLFLKMLSLYKNVVTLKLTFSSHQQGPLGPSVARFLYKRVVSLFHKNCPYCNCLFLNSGWLCVSHVKYMW